MKEIVITSILFIVAHCARSQNQPVSGIDRFKLDVTIKGRDTGKVVLWFTDNQNVGHSDTLDLKEGKFTFEGTVFRVCEALLWTRLGIRSFDDPAVIRFLISPGDIKIGFNPKKPKETSITGSAVQTELENYNITRRHLLEARENNDKALNDHYRLKESQRQKSVITQLGKTRDSIRNEIMKMDVIYIRNQPGSFLSPYLLSRHRRQLPADSSAVLFDNFYPEVKQSSVAKVALREIYVVVDDPQFRINNPLTDSVTEGAIARMTSSHELKLADTSGSTLDFSKFRGKYVVLDFWASWCKPCIAEIPALHEHMYMYRKDPIQFVSVSLDHDAGAWKKAIVAHNYKGLHVFDEKAFKSVVAVYHKVLWVPRYVLIDPNGKVINYELPHPSEPAFKQELDKVLQK